MRGLKRADLVIATAAAGAVALSGCSSSSPHSKAAASASASANALASKFGINPNATLPPGAHGPAGDITAPVTESPNPSSPGGSEVFPNVTRAQRNKMGNRLSAMPGVRAVTYYPQFKQLEVYFTAKASTADRQRVHQYVVAHDPAAAGASGSAAPSPAATPSPSAT